MPSKNNNEGNLHPLLKWAQRNDKVFVTVCLEDCKNPDIKLLADGLTFKSIGGAEQKPYSFDIKFFDLIDQEKSNYVVRPRNIEFVLIKKEVGPFWKSLTKEKESFVKTDFDKWKDEDESDYEQGGHPGMGDFGNSGMGGMPGMGGNFDLQSMMQQMGGFSGGKPGMDMGDLDEDLPESDEDEDDNEELPELGDLEDEKKEAEHKIVNTEKDIKEAA